MAFDSSKIHVLLFMAALTLGACNSASGPTTAYDTFPPPVATEFGEVVFASPPSSGQANTCIGPFIFQILDSEGNPLPNDSDDPVLVSLFESSQTASFYSDSACTQPLGSIDNQLISVGESSMTFYLEFPSAVSDVTITATAAGDFPADSEVATTTINVN